MNKDYKLGITPFKLGMLSEWCKEGRNFDFWLDILNVSITVLGGRSLFSVSYYYTCFGGENYEIMPGTSEHQWRHQIDIDILFFHAAPIRWD